MNLVGLSEVGETVVATVTGEIDVSNVDEVRQALVGLPNRASGLVVDLSRVAYLDSTAISLLHDLGERLGHRSQRLVLVCPHRGVPRRVLELTGLPERAVLVEELEEALALFEPGAAD